MKRTLRDLGPEALSGRRALVRVDYNVPFEDGVVADPTRLDASLATLRHLLDSNARPVLMSHLGRPHGKAEETLSLRPLTGLLEERLGLPVRFAASCVGPDAEAASADLDAGEVLLLENTRFEPGEEANDPEFARGLAALGDLYVTDAFGSLHRAHASTEGVTHFLRPAVAGFLVEHELRVLSRLLHSVSEPFVVAFGGAKISDKIALVASFLDRADATLIGGAMANTFLRARGLETGRSLVEEEALGLAEDLLRRPHRVPRLPVDVIVTDDLDAPDAEVRAVEVDRIPDHAYAVDIGPRTRATFAEAVQAARTVFWNGPMGLFEDDRFARGTFALAHAAAASSREGALTVIGGGDSARAVRQAGLTDAVSHVSTGGGASLEFLAHGTLPGIEALDGPIPLGRESSR